MWILSKFMTGDGRQDLLRRLEEEEPNHSDEFYVRIINYPEVFNYILQTYATDVNISRNHMKIIQLTQRPNQDSLAFGRVIVTKIHRWRPVFDQRDMIRILIEGLNPEICAQARRFAKQPHTDRTFDGIAQYARDLEKR